MDGKTTPVVSPAIITNGMQLHPMHLNESERKPDFMKKTSGNFAAIYINEADKAFSVFGDFEIFPSNTVGLPLKNYDSGKVNCHVKDIDTQQIIKSYTQLSLKIVNDSWNIGFEPSVHQWTSYRGEPYDTILSQVRLEYAEQNPGD